MNKRLQEIVSRVDHLGSVSVNELATQFGVAVETIRRDLRTLEKQEYLKRSHGMAVSILDDGERLTFSRRLHEQAEQKQAVAEKALELIKPGNIIMLDASSSSWYLAKALPNAPLTVISNSLRITFELLASPAIKTVTLGGEYSERYGAFLGEFCLAHASEFQADYFFFSCAGYGKDNGAWESNEQNVAIKKIMLKQANQAVLLCDDSKIGRSGTFRLCKSNKLDFIATEQGLQAMDRKPHD